MKLKKFLNFWHRGAKRFSLLLLSSIFLFGGYVHAQNVNMSRYITLNVVKDSLIYFELATEFDDIPIKIVCGAWDTIIVPDKQINFHSECCYTRDTVITFYGDLTRLFCAENNSKITGIDISHNPVLTILGINNNALTTLDVSNSPSLINLLCEQCSLTSLNVSGCTALQYLYCRNNNLTYLDVSSCTALTFLQCYSNQLTTLNVSGCTVLRNLDCYSNQLISLDLSKNTALQWLQCYSNQLTSLNVSGCTALTELSCYSNQLTSLDVSKNVALNSLQCYGNPFSTKAYNDIMCFLPSRSSSDYAEFFPLLNAAETNATKFLAANASIATAKNWSVYYSNSTPITTTGNDSCLSNGSGSSGPVNMNRYITLNVTKDSLIEISLATDAANTPIRIVSGDSVYNFTTTSTSFTTTTSYRAGANTMTIYGDVKEFLCNNNKTKVIGIDLSQNTALISLNCHSNQLTSLDLSKNVALCTLYCYINQLTSLNVSGCTALTYFYCYDNQLTSLDVSACTALTYLQCQTNQLTSLDVSACTALTYLQCQTNQLTSLDVSKNSKLTTLYCYRNQLTSLDISKNTALTYLACHSNQLTSLDLSKNTTLRYLYCYGNNFSTKAYNDIMCSLPSRSSSDNALFFPLSDVNDTNVTKFTATNASIATAKNWSVYYSNSTPITTTGAAICDPNGGGSMEPVNMNRYITLNVAKDSLISIRLATDAANTPIRIVSGDSVYNFTTTSTSLISGTYYAGANTMTIYGDVTYFACSANNTKITGIDVSNNTSLTSLQCDNNALTTLNVSSCTNLKDLSCHNNALTSLNVSGCTSLERLSCHNNVLTTLNVSGCTSLKDLSCTGNTLTSLDVSGYTALTYLSCIGNALTTLNVSGCTSLESLSCHNNALTTLNVSSCTNLKDLSCHNNALTSLDVRKNTALTSLSCTGNALATLNVSSCTSLVTLYCGNNALTTLDVSKNTALMRLHCDGNNFSTKAYNDIMCSLPSRSINDYASFRPLYNTTDANAVNFIAANASIATAKNWSVYYFNNTSITTTGNDSCLSNGNGSSGPANMNRYITLNVTKDSLIEISLATDAANTPIRIVSGDSVYNFTTTSTSLTNTTSYRAGANTMTIYGDVKTFYCNNNNTKITGIDVSKNVALTALHCNNNQLTSLDLSKNTALTRLYCYTNQLTSLDVSKNTALTELDCHNNALTSLDLSKNTALKRLYCTSNQLTSLDVSQNTALTALQCPDNQLTSLDVSKNTALIYLYCYRNNFSTKAYNDIMCSLPSRSSNENAQIRPLYDANDTNAIKFMATNATNATAKNWQVLYYYSGTTIPATTGNDSCLSNGSGSSGPANMNRYITLNVTKDSLIYISLTTDAAKTPVRIVSGDSVYNFTTTSTSLISGTYYAGANTMTIYGDVKDFRCYDNKTKITGIDASKNVALTALHCNNNQLRSLDLSKNIALIFLDCGSNQLTSLDLSKNTALTRLYCYTNQLTSLDVSKNTALTELDCHNNALTSLDLSKNTALKRLYCTSNQLTSLDVSQNTALTALQCPDNQLTSLDVSKNTALIYLYCYRNNFSTKAYNDIMCSLPSRSSNENAQIRPLYDANDTNAIKFMATNATNATAKNWQVLYYYSGTTIPATTGNDSCLSNGSGSSGPANMNRYITLNVTKDSLIYISLTTNAAKTPVRIVSGDSVYNFTTTSTSLISGTYYAGANTMTIYGDVKDFRCYDNKTKITGIDASNNIALCTLQCYNNSISILDVTKNTALTYLSCSSNQLTSLDVNGCTSLVYLHCYKNQLTTLDVSKNTALIYLSCYDNQLTSIDVSKNTALTYLYCYNNNLTSLDLSNTILLKWLQCNNNQLTTVDLSGCTNVTTLYCHNNQLTTVDLSGCTNVTTLSCYSNQLTSLDVSKNTALIELNCYDNPFTTAGYNDLMCFLPFVTSGTALFRPLYDVTDTNATIFAATNATNATAKNWRVTYYKGGTIPATTGAAICNPNGGGSMEPVNMSRYITLNVTKDSLISISLATDAANTSIRIVSGDSVYDFTTASTNLTNSTKYYAGANTMTIYGDVKDFRCYDNKTKIIGIDVSKNTALTYLSCSDNQLTSLDVSKNIALCTLYCYSSQLTSLDVSKNTALTYLNCGDNQLTSLDVSKNIALCTLQCYNNSISILDVTKNTALTYLNCGDNQLTSLDVSKNVALCTLNCYRNNFSTKAYNDIMCSLPSKSEYDYPVFFPLVHTYDANAAKFVAANASIATAKNWRVAYANVYQPITTTGAAICDPNGGGSMEPVNMSRYITLNVTKDSLFSFTLQTDAANTPIRIVSGDSVYEFIVTGPVMATQTKCYAGANTMTIYGDVKRIDCLDKTKIIGIDASNNTVLTDLRCYSNQLTSLDVSKNIALCTLYCYSSQLTSLDVSKNTALTYLNCYGNQLTSLNLSNNTALIHLDCRNNQLTSLDVSKNTALTYLNCYGNQLTSLDLGQNVALCTLSCGTNQLTSLDVSKNTALTNLVCYGNNFSTKAYNDIMCSLPSRSSNDDAEFIPLYNATDTNAAKFTAANASIATAKNWRVAYANVYQPITTTGAAICNPNGGGSMEPVNMSRYITLNVTKNSLIEISLATDTANTPIRIVSGDWDTTIIAGTNRTSSISYPSNDTIMTIYGDVKDFWCNNNQTKITGIDVSKNVALYTLYCYANQLTSLDVSKNTALTYLQCDINQLTSLNVSGCTALINLSCLFNQLTSLDLSGCTALTNLYCHGNNFSTKAYNDLMCSLPSRSSNNKGNFLPLSNANDANRATFVAANASIATAKNWNVYYYQGSTTITTTGAAICNPNGGGSINVNMSRYITLTVTKNSLIEISLATDTAVTPIRIVSGDWDTTILVGPSGIGGIKCNAGADTMTIYGDVKEFACPYNYSTITGLDASHNTALTYLDGSDILSLTTLNISGCSALTHLSCFNNNLTTLDVSVCTNLRYLNCCYNNLTTLDVSKNTALCSLYCNNNNLTTLDVSKNTALEIVWSMYNQLTSLDVSKNTALTYLNCNGNPFSTKAYNDIMCFLPSRSSSDNAKFIPLYDATDTNATKFVLANASIATAKNWDVVYYPGRTSITTTGTAICNPNGGGSMEPVNMSRYITLTVTPNSQIDLSMMAESDNTAIKVVSGTWDTTIVAGTTWTSAMKYYAQTSSMVIYGEVSGFDCGGGKNTLTITEIDASHNSQLTTMYCDNSNIQTLNLSNCGNLKVLSCHTNKLTMLNVEDCISLEELSCNNNILKTLDLINCTSLLELNCDENNISQLNLNNCSLMTTLSCANNNLTMLNLMNCTSLKFVSCSGNRFSTGGYDLLMCSLPIRSTFENARIYPLSDANDVNSTIFMSTNATNAKNKGWDVLYSDNTVISSTTGNYDCNGGGGQNPEVNQSRYITMNVIPDSVISLDIEADSIYSFVRVVSGSWDTLLIVDTTWTGNIDIYANSNTMIIYGNVKGLDCGGNKSKITRIDVSQNVEMEYLSCKNNDSITSIDLTGCISMKYIYCDGNNLPSLDLKTCQGLLELSCYSNKLTTLDVSDCKSIEYLSCANNNLYMLNVSTCSNLKQLYCQTNWLTMLHIGDCTSLTTLVCNGNRFTTQDYDTIMCLLPMKSSSEGAVFVPLSNSNDANVNQFMITNASNAKGKNWKVNYFDNTSIPSTSGRFDCANVSLEERAISTILLYPNPAQTMLTIENAIGNIQIFDVTGRMLMNVENNDESLLQINVSELAKGMYFVKVGNYTTKFVKE